MGDKDGSQLKTLGRSLEVLALMKSEMNSSCTLSELSQRLELPTSIVFRILKTLLAHGFIRQAAGGKGYRVVLHKADSAEISRRSFKLLRLLSDAYPFSVDGCRLAQRGGITESEALELLTALAAEGAVEKQGEGAWVLAYGCMTLAAPLLERDALVTSFRPIMEELGREIGETITLLRITGDRQVVTSVLPSRHLIRFVMEVGSTYPLYLGAGGKVALAYMPAADARSYLENTALTPNTDYVPVLEDIQIELNKTRRKGYATSVGERVEGACGVAAPIFGKDKKLQAVIGVVSPAFRVPGDKLERMGLVLKKKLAQFGYVSDAQS